jgi:hypothetical protein
METSKMDIEALYDTPPWDWPVGTDRMLLELLSDAQAAESDRLLAAELAGNFSVIDDALAQALLAIVRSGDESEQLRTEAAISLGPVLECADTDGFEDADDVPITEPVFHRIQESLRELYFDPEVPDAVRRQVLEASVRAPEDWHPEAIRAAYASGDRANMLTAVFCMRFVRGFDAQVLEALQSKDPQLHYEAVAAAGNWGLEAAWPHVAALVTSDRTDKPLLLAAIEAVAGIRPLEAPELLEDLMDAEDEDIVDAVYEAIAIADSLADDYYEDDDEDEDDEDEDEEDDEDDDEEGDSRC